MTTKDTNLAAFLIANDNDLVGRFEENNATVWIVDGKHLSEALAAWQKNDNNVNAKRFLLARNMLLDIVKQQR